VFCVREQAARFILLRNGNGNGDILIHARSSRLPRHDSLFSRAARRRAAASAEARIGPVGVAFWFTHSDARSDSKLNSSTTAVEVSLVVFWPLKLCERSPKPSSSKAANSVG
jgi:hypothetical protein